MKALIVDDELRARENLRLLLTDYCNVTILGEAATAEIALEKLASVEPDILFLDIQLPGMDGIELAEKIKARKIPVVFVTAYDQYALQALKASAVDYLLKPTSIKDLREAVDKVRVQNSGQTARSPNGLDALAANMQASKLEQMMVPWEGGFKIIHLIEVSRIDSDNTYCEVHMGAERIVVSKSIGEFETLLEDSGFYRIHYRHMINLAFLDTYTNKEGGQALMKDGTTVPISRRRLVGFKDAANNYFSSR